MSVGVPVSETLQDEVLQHITFVYLNSADFNGISTEELAELVGNDPDGIESTIRRPLGRRRYLRQLRP